MAQKTIVTLIDDLTGEEAEDISTVEFALEGISYEIDLANDNAAKLRDNLARYVAAARKTSARRPGARGADRSTRGAGNAGVARSGYNRDTLRSIREWAKQNG
ncbi:MAG: Lsr2 family protein, partial [Pseudonocardiaceae bacterium]